MFKFLAGLAYTRAQNLELGHHGESVEGKF